MPLTANCDVFTSLSEQAINNVIANVTRQRPSLFNYGTATFVANPQMMCHEIETAPGLPPSQPRVTLESPIPVPGTGGAWGMEYCAQLSKLVIDFHKGNVITLPPELGPELGEQKLALQMEVCGGIACPDPKTLAAIGDKEAWRYPLIDPLQAVRGEKEPPRQEQPPRGGMQTVPIARDRIHCFCLSLYVVASVRRVSGPSGPALAIELEGLEIVDLKPDGLEESIECLLTATLVLGVLPRLRLSISDLVLDLDEYGALTIGLTPISAAVPFNPSVADDALSVLVSATF